MKHSFAIGFLVLIVIGAALWLVGMAGAVVVPMFGGVRAERIAEVLMLIGFGGELLLYLTGVVFHLMNRGIEGKLQPSCSFEGFVGEKRYGNRKPLVAQAQQTIPSATRKAVEAK